jgi:hypothetical protein
VQSANKFVCGRLGQQTKDFPVTFHLASTPRGNQSEKGESIIELEVYRFGKPALEITYFKFA